MAVFPKIEVVAVVHESLKDPTFSVVPDPSPADATARTSSPPVWNRAAKEFQCSWTLDRVFVQNERVLIRWRHKEREAPAFRPVD